MHVDFSVVIILHLAGPNYKLLLAFFATCHPHMIVRPLVTTEFVHLQQDLCPCPSRVCWFYDKFVRILIHCKVWVSQSSVGEDSNIDSWIKRDQPDDTCFIISLFKAQHVSDVNTSILRSLRHICWVTSWVELLWFDVCWCYVVVWLWWCGIHMQAEALVLQPAYGWMY